MKHQILSYAIVALMILSACKKGDNDSPEPTFSSVNGKFSGKVDNISFESSEIGCISDHEDEGSFLLAIADKNDNSIIVSGPNQKGNFSGDNNEYTSGIFQDKTGKMWMSEMEGGTITVTISKFDKSAKKISGTFSFTAPAFTSTEATGTKTVTGSFTDVNYATGTDDDN